MNTEWGQSLVEWAKRHLEGQSAAEPATAPPTADPTACIECGAHVEDWTSWFCIGCVRRHRAISLAKQAYHLAVEMDEVAATLLAGAVDRLERER